MKNKKLETWKEIEFPFEREISPFIHVGEYTYYAGSYNGLFEECCIRYLDEDNENGDHLYIGKFCSIATGVNFNLGGTGNHISKWISTYPFSKIFEKGNNGYFPKGDTIIGNDVWIGTEAIIMPGIKVGDGAIIGARSVVTKDIPPYSIAIGAPAKIIKKRFPDETIKKLLLSKWWNLKKTEIIKLIPLLTSSQVDQFLKKIEEIKKYD